ncbi:MAG TPA: Uma2 family endonuclease [Polyangia bacterium]|jgi:Uma2 family endonuclease|nr:Uma2 family endonuclease [Polyangia bacterium]
MALDIPGIEDSLPRQPARRPRALVVRDLTPEQAAWPVDWSSWYLTEEEDMGESSEQGEIIRLLLSCLSEWAREQGWSRRYCGSNQFFAWIEREPLVRVSPDVYVIDDPPEPPLPRMWQTWLPGHRPPRFAVEVVSEDWKKDYEENPLKYAQLGVRELVIFDPEALSLKSPGERVAMQLYRRGEDGAFVRTHAGAGPVYSEELGAYLVVRKEGAVARLRLARDPGGAALVPTVDEARQREAEARQREAEARQREAEARQAAERVREEEAAARARAEARVRELEEALRKLRADRPVGE